MAVARFLQISDLHLGRSFGWLPAEKRAERRADQRRALERAVREAIERGIHAILIPGDLFDADGVDAETMAFTVKVFEVPGCPPVFITPGNHDPWSESSHLWSARMLKARGWSWPETVHIFTTANWSAATVPNLSSVHVYGRCFTSSAVSTSRPLEEGSVILPDSADAQGLEIAMFHGSNEEKCPPGQKVTAPFSEKEIAHSPFAYHAVGHYHVPSRIEQKGGDMSSTTGRGVSGRASAGVRLAYAGSPIALDLSETGEHGALEVRVEYGGRQPMIEVEPIALDRRRTFDLNADISGCSSAEQVDRRVQKALDEAGVSELDLAQVRLQGRLAHGLRYAGASAEMQRRAFFLRVDLKRVRPDYDLDRYRREEPSTTEARFARALLDRIDAEKDPEEKAVLESALYYGLDAFKLREVMPAYEDLGA
ncbi:MAG TPA: DNA repair exonuclease [Candidatus Sulfotelmatobacter sp.]|nr:DNA repair exonuclease [Candidatus Sulfotelmatobacter sp.]